MRNRPNRRTLVRWNDDHDKELLLWMNYCCTESGIKIPWARIAQCMGASFTEGACIQHLAKIRTKMEEAGLHVPPVQKRGTITKTGSSIYRPKLKEITAPVPRIRPDIPPQAIGEYFLDDDEEEEEEDEDQVSPAAARGSRVSGSSVRRQMGRHRFGSVKEESEIDDEHELYDSDNEYGAKKTFVSPYKKSTGEGTPPKTQMRFSFGGKQPASQGDRTQADMDQHDDKSGAEKMQWGQTSPALKFETLAESRASEAPTRATSSPRGIRRKSSALNDEGEEDGDYDPGTKAKSKPKKPRTSRTSTKKQKGTRTDKSDITAGPDTLSSYQGSSPMGDDRLRMPPPTRPASSDRNHAWNNNFMMQPFASSNSYDSNNNTHYGGQDNNGFGLGDYPASYSHSGSNFDLDQRSTSGPKFYPYALPTKNFDCNARSMDSGRSIPSTRNHSYASSISTSSVEAQPPVWKQPHRSLGFPNPREATTILNQAINADEDSIPYYTNAYKDRMDHLGLSDAGDCHAVDEPTVQLGDCDNSVAIEDTEGLFVGPPDTDFGFEEFMNL